MDADFGQKRVVHRLDPGPLRLAGLIAPIDTRRPVHLAHGVAREHVPERALGPVEAVVLCHHHWPRDRTRSLHHAYRVGEPWGEGLLHQVLQAPRESFNRVLRVQERGCRNENRVRGCLRQASDSFVKKRPWSCPGSARAF